MEEQCILRVKRTVQMHETDAAGVMHFSNYYRWMESAEGELFDKLGIEIFNFDPNDFRGWPRVEASCRYRLPIFFREEAEMEVFITQLSFKIAEVTVRFFKDVDGKRKKAAEGTMRIIHARKDPATGALKASLMPDAAYQALLPYAPAEEAPVA